ncbi:MAG: hypothetical protein AUK35_00590 [Zetaproteobacteria bacterium CG2_30_46_52]|nr:MAG: hypothetical protein AUK35_00590 [Zetaproteobacteria bacterium CG2_30_46_52]
MIMIADDEGDVLDTLKSILELHDFQVIACPSAESALEQYDLHRGFISAVISDYHLASMNGLRLLQEIQQQQSSIRAILISGNPPQNMPESIKLFKKPINYDALVDYLKRQKLT